MIRLLSLRKRYCQGFTLVELLVVISILAILAIISIVAFTNIQKGARDAKRRGDIQAISTALELYKSVNGSYPKLCSPSPCTGGAISIEANWDCSDGRTECLKKYLVTDNNLMQELPKDPKNSGTWATGKFYKYHSDGSFYQVAASLENVPGTGNFTYNCATSACSNAPGCINQAGAHMSVSDCTYDKTRGGFGYDSQQ